MRVRPSREVTVSLESVALTDMVLNLFIFFFISFSLLYTFSPERLARIPVKPPRVTTPISTKPLEKSVVVTMDHTGLLYVGQESVTFSSLTSLLQQALATSERHTVLIRADRLVTIKEVVRVMELAKQVGAEDVSIAVVHQARPPTDSR